MSLDLWSAVQGPWCCHHYFLLLVLRIFFFFLVGPGPLHEIAVSTFSRSPFGRAATLSFQYLPSTPRTYLSVSPLSLCFLALAFAFLLSFLLLLSCTAKVSLWILPFLEYSGGVEEAVVVVVVGEVVLAGVVMGGGAGIGCCGCWS